MTNNDGGKKNHNTSEVAISLEDVRAIAGERIVEADEISFDRAARARRARRTVRLGAIVLHQRSQRSQPLQAECKTVRRSPAGLRLRP
jgi:hypothetical protein